MWTLGSIFFRSCGPCGSPVPYQFPLAVPLGKVRPLFFSSWTCQPSAPAASGLSTSAGTKWPFCSLELHTRRTDLGAGVAHSSRALTLPIKDLDLFYILGVVVFQHAVGFGRPRGLKASSHTHPSPTPGSMSLAADLESEPTLRNVGRETHGLMCWPDKKSQGVASMKACSLNSALLGVTSRWWVQMTAQPSAIPIDLLRCEVWWIFQTVCGLVAVIQSERNPWFKYVINAHQCPMMIIKEHIKPRMSATWRISSLNSNS